MINYICMNGSALSKCALRHSLHTLQLCRVFCVNLYICKYALTGSQSDRVVPFTPTTFIRIYLPLPLPFARVRKGPFG